jgi:sugar phosphate isomerase/epimerase
VILGYNTNGFAHHRLEDAIEIIAELGYRGVALTPDVHDFEIAVSTVGWHLTPRHHGRLFKTARHYLRHHGLKCVIETGARFLLDPQRKHQPTLISGQPDLRRGRLDFLKGAVLLAGEVGADCVSLWSGSAIDPVPPDILWQRLIDGCEELADFAAGQDVRLAFEPEPGMFIDTMDKFAELHARVNHPAFGLTVDVGHLVCNDELPVSDHLVRWKDWLWNVHVEDMRRGVHDHLMFGEGEVDFADVFAGLRAAEYEGMVSVELSRHSHDAVNTARRSMEFLRRYL